MAFREQVQVSQKHLPAKWTSWLRGHYALAPLSAPAEKIATNGHAKNGLHSVVLADASREDVGVLRDLARLPGVRLIGILRHAKPAKSQGLPWFGWIPQDAPREVVQGALATAFENIRMAEREAAVRMELARTEREMRLLHEVGIALSAAHDSAAVLDLILRKAREVTGADAGSIYIVEERRTKGEEGGEFERLLRFQLSENDSVPFDYRELTLPISEASIAGYVALHGRPLSLDDAYKLPASAPYGFNRALDERHGYRTRSVLALPMKNAKGEVLGVLQLINCKRNPGARLANPKSVARNVRPFPDRLLQMTLSLASQAAVSYENAKLYQDIEKLFEGFVKAAVTAIEQRDPTTSGHSHRVSTMTCGLASIVDKVRSGSYANVRFTPEQMREIRYAALLHDFGKVAVREEVLIKAKKLYPWQLDMVESRFDYARKDLEARYQKCKLDAVMRAGVARSRAEVERLERELRDKLGELQDAFEFVLRVNEPTVLPEGNFDRLHEIAQHAFHDPRGHEQRLLTADEIRYLSIPKGSLDPSEREQIESHVVHSFNFLMQIPWTKNMRDIPKIARAHHEKLNGTGYPYRLKAEAIPVQAKIMTICDIFDALSASDRPYKRAVSYDRALTILEMSVKDNELDPELYELFVDAKVFELMQKNN